MSKRVLAHLVEALRNQEEEPPVEVPMGEPLEDLLEDPMDEETEEGPMFEGPIEIEESEEDPEDQRRVWRPQHQHHHRPVPIGES